MPNTLVFKIVGTPDDSYYFAATELGPYVYLSDEETWVDLAGISAPDQTYWSVEFISELNTARFGTYGRGIWDFIIENHDVMDGDVNQDGFINIQDLVLLITFILNSNDPNDQEFQASDMNNDNILNILDIVLIVNIILNP